MELIDTNNRQMECCIKMDYNEAKLRLKDHFMIHNDGRPTPYLDEAARMAYEALGKQIPKKPIYASIDGFTLPVPYYCPVCGEQIAKYDAYARCLFKEHHCECGQRIDWSEVE